VILPGVIVASIIASTARKPRDAAAAHQTSDARGCASNIDRECRIENDYGREARLFWKDVTGT
jgi:hypothetical protein